jgi:hypothetical protein
MPMMHLRNIVVKPPEAHGIEIYGLNMTSNGRECANHSCCGQSISPGSLIKLQESEVVIHEVMEYAIRAISLDERSYGCTIGFIPRFLL